MQIPTAGRLICGTSPHDATMVEQWWTDQAYGIACYTREVFDALQIPTQLGE